MMTPLVDALRDLLASGSVTSQEEICASLMAQGYDVNQSKISRLLRKVGAIKSKNKTGELVYHLPWEPAPPTVDSQLKSLVIDIQHNETLIVVTTTPGAAQLIARVLDYHQENLQILGTIAGDDTVFIAPAAVAHLAATVKELKSLLL